MKRKREKITSTDQELVSFANLPSDITTHIVLQLPVESIATCKCVCKTWNALISDPLFAKSHLECAPLGVMIGTQIYNRGLRTLHVVDPEKFESESLRRVKLMPGFKLHLRDAKLAYDKGDETMDWVTQWPGRRGYDSFGVVNSCNGLLCLHHPEEGYPLVVCNPLLGEFITLPDAIMYEKTWGPVYAGFGFHPKTNEYKVVRIWMNCVERRRKLVSKGVIVEMHTLGTTTWRKVGVDLGPSINMLQFPTYLNGALHWISFDAGKRSILCFTFDTERFQSFPFPSRIAKHNRIHNHPGLISMAELGGFLYICDASSRESCTMWVMKKYSVGESWTKVFKINYLISYKPSSSYGLCWPVKHSKKRAAILMQYSGDCFLYYEPQKHGFKVFRVLGTQSTLFEFEAVPHIPSFISLKHVVKNHNTKVPNVHSRCAKFKLRKEKNEAHFLTRC